MRRTKIEHGVFKRNEWSERRGRPPHADHVDLWCRRLEIRLLFRILTSIDRMAKRAQMSAVERFGNRAADGILFRVIHNHRCPCDGLERQPLQTDCATERENRDPASNPTNHAGETSCAMSMRQSRGRSSVIQSRAIFASELRRIRDVDIWTTAERIEKYRAEFTFVPVFR